MTGRNQLLLFCVCWVVVRGGCAARLQRSTTFTRHQCFQKRRVKPNNGIILGNPHVSPLLLSIRGGSDGRGPPGSNKNNNNYNYNDYHRSSDDFSQRNRGNSSNSYDPETSGFYDQGDQGGYDDRDWRQDEDDYGKSSRSRRDYDDDGYDDRRGRRSDAVQKSLSSLPSKFKYGDRRIGVPLLGLGALFTVLGVSLFFNKALMRMGNLMFIAGVPMTIGPSRCAGYFLNPKKARASACIVVGIFLVFIGWPVFGIVLEVFGLLNLFGNMFPLVWAVVKNMPFVSWMVKSTEGSGGNRRSSGRSYDDYDDRHSYRDNQQYNYDDDNRDDDDSRFY